MQKIWGVYFVMTALTASALVWGSGTAAATAPALCTSAEEDRVDDNAISCHAKRAASAAYRARGAAEYAGANHKGQCIDTDVPRIQKRAEEYAAKTAAAKTAKGAAQYAESTAAMADALSRFAYTGCESLPPLYVGLDGEAAEAASTAYTEASHTGTYGDFVNAPQAGVRIGDNKRADDAEVNAVEAAAKARWIE